jgi:hypothetical protein
MCGTRPPANAPSLVMDSDHRQVRNGERREWRRPACPLRARTTQSGYFFSVGYHTSLSYEDLDVLVVVNPVSRQAPGITGRDLWLPGFFDSTAGAFRDEPLERGDQGGYQHREPLACAT